MSTAALELIVQLKGEKEAAAGLANVGDKAGALGKVMTGLAVVGIGGVGLALADSVGKFAEFDQIMAAVRATTGGTDADLAMLKQTALDLGKATDVGSVSASDAAAAIFELGKAGIETDAIAGGVAKSVLQLAAAAGPDFGVANAASLAANALATFNLDASESTRVVNTLVGASNASSIGLQELKQGFSDVGAVAAGVGLSIEDTSAALAIFGNNGLSAGTAGGAFKTMLLNLQPSTDKQTRLMEELGIITQEGANQFFTAEGKAKDLAGISGVLEKALEGQTAQQNQSTLETLFGSEAVTAATILAKEGAGGVNQMTEAMLKQGDAAKVAGDMSNNLQGKWEAFMGTVETLQIGIGDKLAPVLTGLIDWMGSPEVMAGVQSLADGLMTGLGMAFDFIGGVIDTIGPPLKNVFNFLKDNAGPAGIALAGIIMGFVVPAFIAWATTMLTVTLPALVATMSPILAAAAPFIALGLAVGALWMAFDSNFLGIRDIVLGAWAAMQPAIQAMQDAWTGFVQIVVDAWAGFMAIIQPQIDNILGLVNGVVTAFQSFFTTIGGGGDIMGALGTLFGDLGGLIGDFIMNTLQWLADAIPKIVEVLVQWGGAFLGWVGTDVLPFIGGVLQTLGEAIWTWITGGGLMSLIENLVTWGGAILNFIAKDVLPFIGQKLLDLGNAIWTWITGGGLTALIGNLVSWGGAFLGWIAKDVLPFLGAKIAEIATAIWTWITTTAGELVTNIKVFATSFWTWITDTVKNLPAKIAEIATAIWKWITDTAKDAVTKAAKIGSDIIGGILQGLKDAASAIWTWLTGFLGGMVQGVKDFFGIKSPSQLMADEVGVPIVQGMQDGMEGEWPKLLDAVKGMLGQLATGMKVDYLAQITDQNIIGNDEVSQELLRQHRGTWAALREAGKQDINELMASDADAYLQALKNSPVIGDAAGAEMIEQSRKAWAGLRAADGAEIQATGAGLIDGAESFFRSYFGSVASFYQTALALLVSQTHDGVANILAEIARMNNTTSNGVPLDENGLPRYQTDPGYRNPNYGGGQSTGGGGDPGRGRPEARAGGGSVWAGRPYWVGERGPELFVPQRSGGITPNGAGGDVFNVTIHAGAGVNGDQLAEEFVSGVSARIEQRRSLRNAYSG